MKTNSGIISLALTLILLGPLTSVRSQYQDHKQILQKAETLGRQYPDLCLVKSLVNTMGGNDIWLITVGTGIKDNKPGVAVWRY